MTYYDDHGNLARHFDAETLLHFIESSGGDAKQYRETVNVLEPAFRALSSGKTADYEQISRESLENYRAEITTITNWMLDSDDSSMRIIAMQLIGFLGLESFIPKLAEHVRSGSKPERLAAIAALGDIPQEASLEALKPALSQEDADIRAAAASSFFKLSDRL